MLPMMLQGRGLTFRVTHFCDGVIYNSIFVFHSVVCFPAANTGIKDVPVPDPDVLARMEAKFAAMKKMSEARRAQRGAEQTKRFDITATTGAQCPIKIKQSALSLKRSKRLKLTEFEDDARKTQVINARSINGLNDKIVCTFRRKTTTMASQASELRRGRRTRRHEIYNIHAERN